ncbi:MAG: ATP-binding protein [Planctomycetia bacterium]|nr:ATP-binding protein [Planctomycetia bacterium]
MIPRPGDDAADGRTLDAILAGASEETRATIAILGEILGRQPASSLSPAAFAIRHLAVDATRLASTRFTGPGTSVAILGNLLRIEMERHGDAVVVGSPGDGLPPSWSHLDLGPDDTIAVPGRLVAFFPAGTLAGEPVCVLIDDRHWAREFAVLSAAAAKPAAEGVLERFCDRLKTAENPLRGRVLEATVAEGSLKLGITPARTTPREGLILPDAIWAEVDVFLAAATSRRELLRRLGLGTNRGLLVAGPPGVGKTHLVRVIASALGDRYTTILADANAMRHMIAELYAASETFGPTLVVLDDIDLVLGHRDSNGDNAALADFLATLDGVLEREDVLTIATTNDPQALDPAAQRSSRFDMVVTLPLPDEASRARILARHLAPLGLDVDHDTVSRSLDGASGADVKEVVRRAVLEHGERFTQAQLLDITRTGRWQAAVNRRRYLS